ncbi:hypothetical protein BGZ82_001121 [Podila clonocystis]|nr:hypothetical protein BGZ82_001121 [Podila clonocystis]
MSSEGQHDAGAARSELGSEAETFMTWSSSQMLQDESLMDEMFSLASDPQFDAIGFDSDGESENEEQKEQDIQGEAAGTELYYDMFPAPSTNEKFAHKSHLDMDQYQRNQCYVAWKSPAKVYLTFVASAAEFCSTIEEKFFTQH